MEFEKIDEPFFTFCDEYLCRELSEYKISLTTDEEITKYRDIQFKDYRDHFMTVRPYTRLCPKHFKIFLEKIYQGPYDELTWDLII